MSTTWPERDNEHLGIYDKYNVIDTRSGDMVKEPTFTLLMSDPHAKSAMLAYARSVANDNPTLARDIWDLFPDDALPA